MNINTNTDTGSFQEGVEGLSQIILNSEDQL